MESKLLEVTFKSNSRSLSIDNDLYKITGVEGFESSDFNVNISQSAQFDGGIVVNKRIQARAITISGEFVGKDNKEIERQRLISFFNPKKAGTLIVNYCGIERAIEYEVENFDAPIINMNDPLSFTVDLICSRPYFMNYHESKVNVALWKGAFRFPLNIPKNKGITVGIRQPSLIVNVFNNGDTNTGMVIEFMARGTMKNPSLFNVNTREFLKINKSMIAGEKIIVDTNVGKKKIINKLNGIEMNILNLIDLKGGGYSFLQLDIGDNLFRYDADENIDNLEINIYFKPQYLGV